MSYENYLEKKQAKQEAVARASHSRMARRSVTWLIFGVLIASAGYIFYSFLDRPQASVGEFFVSQSRDHIGVGAAHPEYNSNPPTGGWHYAAEAQTGMYDVEFRDEQLVHNLEHGHVWIAHAPNLPAGQIEQLADIVKDYGNKIIMAPRSANTTAIAIVAWEYLLTLDSVDEAKIREFIDAHRGRGPESIPDFGFDDFRGKSTPTPLPGI